MTVATLVARRDNPAWDDLSVTGWPDGGDSVCSESSAGWAIPDRLTSFKDRLA